MKSRDELNSTAISAAIHEAGHAAACIILDMEFDAVYLTPSPEHPGLVASLARKAAIDYSSGVLTPEEESLSTNLVIIAFAGPACDAMHEGRTSFDFNEYDDLDAVLDAIEYRFSNNNVRMTFARYCEAEAFALFEDDKRLWRFANVLARELVKHKKLTYAQCTELYSKEYLVESWVRKEVDEIRREGEAKGKEAEDRKEEGGIAANYEQRAAKIEKKHKEGPKEERKGPKPEHKPPVQDREVPRQVEVTAGSAEGGGRPAEEGGAQQERRGRRRRRGRGRGRGKKREGVLEQLPGEVIGGQPQVANEPRPEAPVENRAAQRPVEERRQEQKIEKKELQQGIVAAQGGETPKTEERVKKQVIKAIKPPVPEEAAIEAPKPAVTPATGVPPIVEQRPVVPPTVVPPPATPQEARPAAAQQPKRRPAVSGGPKAEGRSVSGGKETTHPDSIWEVEKGVAKGEGRESQQRKEPTAKGTHQEEKKVPEAKGGEQKPPKAARSRATKATKAQVALPETPGEQKKNPAGEKPKARQPKAARTAPKTVTPPTKAVAPEAPVKKARTAPAKKPAPKGEPKEEKKLAAGTRRGGKKNAG